MLEVRQLLTAPPMPAAAQQFVPAINSFATTFLDDASDATSTLLSDTVTAPMAALNGLFVEARDQVLGIPMVTMVDPTMMNQITSWTPGISSIFGSMSSIPDAVLPQQFDLGTETSTSDEGGSYWTYGTHGNLQYNSNDLTGSANTYIARYQPASGEVTTDIFVGSAELIVQQGGAPSIQFDATQLKTYTSGDADNWVAHVTMDEYGLNGFFQRSLRLGPATISTQIDWSNSQIVSKTAKIDFVLPGQELHAEYQWGTSSDFRKMSYINTVLEDTTLIADYVHSSQDGTNIAAGIGKRLTERLHISSIVARYTPVSGPSHTAGLIRGALRSSTSPLALVFDAGITDGIANIGNPWTLENELDLLPQSPYAIRFRTMTDYETLTSDVFGDVQKRY